MNFNQYTKLLKSNVARTIVENKTNIPNLSFKGLEVVTGGGPAMVMPDRFCGTNRVYGLNMPSWSYIHLGDPVEMYALDGNSGLREANLDAQAFRFFSFGNTVCDEPSANITINVTP